MRSLLGPLARGVAAGLVAGLVLTTVQALARLLLGVPPPAELIGDRIAPLLTIEEFFGLFGVFGGYNGLKQAGILGGTGGQLAVGVAIAVAVALAARRSAARAWRLLAVLTALLYLAAVAVLWPILSTGYTGYSSGSARLITLLAMAVGFGAFAVAVAVVLRLPGAEPAAAEPTSLGRRALLVGGVAGVGLAAATGGLGTALYRRATFSYDGTSVNGPGITAITPNDRFYTVTKNVVDPRVDPARWCLAVDGAVRTPQSFDLAALRGMPGTMQETTLMCISNPVGGGLQSNAIWTGVPLAGLLTAAQPTGTPVQVLLTAVDGYTDTLSIEKAMEPTTLLAYGMNGEELPQRHGFPVRLIAPGLYGEKNLKWISKVDVVTEEARGFYETQGWGPIFVVPTRARISEPHDATPVSRGGIVPLRGTASGGDRGVSRVEVSVDDGRTWQDATITYPGTRLSWVLWSYDWRPSLAGTAAIQARATDGTGEVQTVEQRGSVPQGATGYHRILVTVI
jgi:DMSO/TMAO reductase YedYZ molybdopterin-dependent catalytic subunit